METGWITTEVGRQPFFIVYGILRTADAVSPAPGIAFGFVAVALIYAVLTVLTGVLVLRRLAHSHEVGGAWQELEVVS